MGRHVVNTLFDTFKNFVANLNTSRDKQSAGEYFLETMTEWQWSIVYRVSWMAQKVVRIPAMDATREWRDWKAESEQIEAIEAEEKRLQIQQKVYKGMLLGRLHGGAGLYFSINGDDPSLPLEPESVRKGDLDFVTVFPRTVLAAGEIEYDPMEPGYGKPKYYTVSGTGRSERIHPSRLVIFQGNEILDPNDTHGVIPGWSDSVLQAAYEAIRNADSTAANAASLVYEAKVDVLKIPNMTQNMGDKLWREALQERVQLGATLKGINGMLVIDSEEEYEQKTMNFAGIPDIGYQALQSVSGASDIPITRFLGEKPRGLNSTGESELKNYYDAVASGQDLVLSPALINLDEVIIRSALGDRPKEIYYEWASLWQMSAKEQSEIGKETAETIGTLVKTALFDEDSLAKASVNVLTERSVLPGLELRENFTPREQGTPGIEDPDSGLGGNAQDATTPRTLYVSRRVLNVDDFVGWARSQGFASMLEDLHVTIAYSRTPIDWTKLGADWSEDEHGRVKIWAGGPRVMEQFEQATVLAFANDRLDWRHRQIREAGASWDYDDFTPHVTITYNGMPDDVEPYQGPIILGPERFKEIKEGEFEPPQEKTL